MKKHFLLAGTMTLLILVLNLNYTCAQGCSDAGICTIHGIKDNTTPNVAVNEKNVLKTGVAYGNGEQDVHIITTYIEFGRTLSDKIALNGRLTFSSADGELGTASGFGDLFFTLNKVLKRTTKSETSIILGFKLPLSNSKLKENGIVLPMAYQSSLGTVDLIAGVNYHFNSFGATVAFQQPLSESNDNTFMKEDYPSNQAAQKYLSTNMLQRRGDLLLRVAYQFNVGKKFSIRPGILPIYHLVNDRATGQDQKIREIEGSRGLTFNANLFLIYQIKNSSNLELSFGSPFIARDKIPDGLKRSFVASLDYMIAF